MNGGICFSDSNQTSPKGLSYVVAIILFSTLIITSGVLYLTSKKMTPHAYSSSILVVCFSIFDFATDCLFAYDMYLR